MAASAGSERSHSPISRTGTPGIHDPNIAPQHIFDSVHLGDQNFSGSPSLPPLNLGQSPTTIDGASGYEALVTANTNLRTRVSELEVINMVYSDNENSLRSERDNAIRERDEFKRKLEELEKQLQDATSGDMAHPAKKARLSPPTDGATTTEPPPASAAPDA
jgi:GATA-binding protein, other eukaryote